MLAFSSLDPYRVRPLVLAACCAALVAFFPGSADAAKPAKKAAAVLKKEGKAFVKSLKKDLAVERGILSANLAAIDAKLKAGDGVLNDVSTLFSDVVQHQAAVKSLMDGKLIPAKDVVLMATKVLDDAGFAAVDYPRDFQYGRGGAVDRFYRDIQKAVDASTKKARSRIQKTVKLFEKKAGIGVICRIESPSTVLPTAFGPAQWWLTFSVHPTSIDTLITASDLAATNDGRLYAAGTGWSTPGTNLRIGSTATTYAASQSTSLRWEFVIFGLAEGADQLEAWPSTLSFVHATARAFSIR